MITGKRSKKYLSRKMRLCSRIVQDSNYLQHGQTRPIYYEFYLVPVEDPNYPPVVFERDAIKLTNQEQFNDYVDSEFLSEEEKKVYLDAKHYFNPL